MPNKFLVAALAAAVMVSFAGPAPAASKKKKVKNEQQTEESAAKDAMDEAVLDIAAGFLGGAMKKGKMPKGGKLIMKQGLKAVKDSAKKSKDGKKDGGKKDAGKKNPLKMLMGGGDE